jgi:hypothetical protein
MSSFSLEARLDTPNPFLIEFLGPPSAVVHKIAGKLVMNVAKPIQLKQLTVAFIGQGKRRKSLVFIWLLADLSLPP